MVDKNGVTAIAQGHRPYNPCDALADEADAKSTRITSRGPLEMKRAAQAYAGTASRIRKVLGVSQ